MTKYEFSFVPATPCNDIANIDESTISIIKHVRLGSFADGINAVCSQPNDNTITFKAKRNGSLVPLVAIFESNNPKAKTIQTTKSNLKRICQHFRYSHFHGISTKSTLAFDNVEIEDNMRGYEVIHSNSEAWESITCFKPGKFYSNIYDQLFVVIFLLNTYILKF